MEENSLAHYGVLGMKWGVRKNPSKAGRKAVKKLRKLDARRKDAELSGEGYANAAAKARVDAAVAGSRKERKEFRRMAKVADNLSRQSFSQASKYAAKGKKWASKMTEILGDTKLSDVSKLDLDFAATYGFDYKKRD